MNPASDLGPITLSPSLGNAIASTRTMFGSTLSAENIKAFLTLAGEATIARLHELRLLFDTTFPDIPGYERPQFIYEGVSCCLLCVFHKAEEAIIPRMRRVAADGPLLVKDIGFLSHLVYMGEAIIPHLDKVKAAWEAAGRANTGGERLAEAEESGAIPVYLQDGPRYCEGDEYGNAIGAELEKVFDKATVDAIAEYKPEGADERWQIEARQMEEERIKTTLARLFGIDPDKLAKVDAGGTGLGVFGGIEGKKPTHEQPAGRQ
jgi:hypothetical protein